MESSRLIRGQTSGCLRCWTESREAAGTAERFAPERQTVLRLCTQPQDSTKALRVPYSRWERERGHSDDQQGGRRQRLLNVGHIALKPGGSEHRRKMSRVRMTPMSEKQGSANVAAE